MCFGVYCRTSSYEVSFRIATSIYNCIHVHLLRNSELERDARNRQTHDAAMSQDGFTDRVQPSLFMYNDEFDTRDYPRHSKQHRHDLLLRRNGSFYPGLVRCYKQALHYTTQCLSLFLNLCFRRVLLNITYYLFAQFFYCPLHTNPEFQSCIFISIHSFSFFQ